MNKPRIIVISIAGLVTVSGVATGGWLWERAQQSSGTVVASDGGSIPLDQGEAGTPASQRSLNAPNSPSNHATSSSSGKGAVSGTTNLAIPTATPTGSTTVGFPGPSDFGQYDQYKNAASALYIDVVPGTGVAVAAGSHLKVNYQGWLTNGQTKPFDQNGTQPYELTEGDHAVISGWEEGLFGMKAGGKRRLIIPPAFGYGSQGQGPIPGDAVLVFDVELLEVK